MKKTLFKRGMTLVLSLVLLLTGIPGNLNRQIKAESEVCADTTLKNPVIVADASMDAGQKVTWDCLWFGSYPQTEIVGKAETCGTYGRSFAQDSDYEVDENLYNTLVSATDWDDNEDTVIGGVKYRRVNAQTATNAYIYNPENDWGDVYYKWENDSSFHYFRYEPIKWRVLDVKDGKALLLSDKALDDRAYNTDSRWRKWADYTLRVWLDGFNSTRSFYHCAFNVSERKGIVETHLDNKTTGPYSSTSEEVDTSDRAFLLSSYDLCQTPSYGFVKEDDGGTKDEARRCKSTTFAKAMGAWTCAETSTAKQGNCVWWLRSPGRDSGLVADVSESGRVNLNGNAIDVTKDDAIRPALYLNIGSTDLWSYAGTVSSDGTQTGYRASEETTPIEKKNDDVKSTKSKQPMTVKVKKRSVKYSKLRKKARTVKAITVSKAKGKVSYKIVKGNAKSKKALKMNGSNGKITIKKKTKKGTYKLKVKVTAAGNEKYEAGSKTVTVSIKVK